MTRRTTPFPAERLWTLRELAAAMGITHDSLRQRVNRNTVDAVKLGRDWFVTEAEAQRVLKAKAQ